MSNLTKGRIAFGNGTAVYAPQGGVLYTINVQNVANPLLNPAGYDIVKEQHLYPSPMIIYDVQVRGSLAYALVTYGGDHFGAYGDLIPFTFAGGAVTIDLDNWTGIGSPANFRNLFLLDDIALANSNSDIYDTVFFDLRNPIKPGFFAWSSTYACGYWGIPAPFVGRSPIYVPFEGSLYRVPISTNLCGQSTGYNISPDAFQKVGSRYFFATTSGDLYLIENDTIALLGHLNIGGKALEAVGNFVYAAGPNRLFTVELSTTASATLTARTTNSATLTVQGSDVQVLIKGLRGPSVSGVNDPILELRDSTGTTVLQLNNDWQEMVPADISATGHSPNYGSESAILTYLAPGAYTIVEEGNCGQKGAGVIDVFDLTNNIPLGQITTDTGVDTDGDALPDEWETRGLTVTPVDVCYPADTHISTGGEFIDLHRMGADAKRKDIFVHADWMAADGDRIFKPLPEAIATVAQAFVMAPVINGHGHGSGIVLHVDLGRDSVMVPGETWGPDSKATEVQHQAIIGDFIDKRVNPDLETVFKRINFYPAKRQHVFHYALFGDKFLSDSDQVTAHVGVSALPGRDLFVALGSGDYPFQRTSLLIKRLAQAATFMHELGHNLGLRHGGDVDLPNGKPNYRSVMNYLFCLTGKKTLVSAPSESPQCRYTIDYNQDVLPVLDENAMSETLGIGAPVNEIVWWKPDAHGLMYEEFNHLPAVDWNKDGTLDPLAYVFNVTGDQTIDRNMEAYQDWFAPLMFDTPNVTIPSNEKAHSRLSGLEPVADELYNSIPKTTWDALSSSPTDIFTMSKTKGDAPLTVDFDGGGSQAVEGSIVSWLWNFGDGSSAPGATANHTYERSGNYVVQLTVADSNGRINVSPLTTTIHVTGTASAAPKLANISTRGAVGAGDNVLIGGFIITGTQRKTVIARAIGPSLTAAGISTALSDPTLELHNAAGVTLGSNDNWVDSAVKQAIADSTIPPANSLESAIVASLPPDAYTVVVKGVNQASGIALVELYDLNPEIDAKLANISTRGVVQTGDNVMIGGFIITGDSSQNVIVRAIGPSIPLSGNLADPTLELFDANGASIGFNDNWRSDQETEIIATTIPPTNDLEAAMVKTLAPGAYTAIVRGKNNSTGVALVEVYSLN